MDLPEFLVDHPDGEIRLKGHRIGLFDILLWSRRGETPEMLHRRFPTVSVSFLCHVLTFALDNKADADAYIAEYQADLDRLRSAAPSGPSRNELRQGWESRQEAEAR